MKRKSVTMNVGIIAEAAFDQTSRSLPAYATLVPSADDHISAVEAPFTRVGPARTNDLFSKPGFVRALTDASAMSRTSTRWRPTSPSGCAYQ
ncbi:MAG: hypothetical protein JNL38_32450, partial [Myxococcales bacterium]|nr:hypothetical protein [Myxococcales bacterium]